MADCPLSKFHTSGSSPPQTWHSNQPILDQVPLAASGAETEDDLGREPARVNDAETISDVFGTDVEIRSAQ